MLRFLVIRQLRARGLPDRPGTELTSLLGPGIPAAALQCQLAYSGFSGALRMTSECDDQVTIPDRHLLPAVGQRARLQFHRSPAAT